MTILSRGIYIRRIVTAALAFLAIVAISGCAETSQVEASGKGSIRGINSIVTSPDLSFLIEERSLGNIAFKAVVGFTEYDNLSYNFNFDLFLPQATAAIRLATQPIDVVADTEYTVVLTGTIADPAIMSWEAEERVWDGTETVIEADFAHLSPALGEVDVYFAPAGTVPVLGNAIGSFNYGDRIPYLEFAATSFEMIITPKDDIDPANYLFQSQAISSTPATRVTFAIFDSDPSITADIAVNLINPNGGSTTLADINKPARFRLLHTAFGTDRVDGFLDSDFGNIVFSDIGFGEISPYVEIETVTKPFTLTDVGNSGAPVHEADIIIGSNSKRTIILGGEPGALGFRELPSDSRPLEGFPVVRITNMSFNAAAVSLYMLPPGTSITEETVPQFAGLPTLVDTGFFGPAEGTQELTLTLLGEIAPISTPLTINIADGDIVDLVVLDTADPAVVDLVIIDSTLP